MPAILVTAIAVVSSVALAQNESIPDDHLTVEVTARQFVWSFKYPQYGGIESGILYLPKGRTAELRLKRSTSSTPSGCPSSARSRTPCPARRQKWR